MNINTTLATIALSFGLASAMEGMDMSHMDHSGHASESKAVHKPDSAKSGDLVLSPTAAELKKAKPAKNKICPVDNAAIGSMGEPVYVIWKGQAVALSCPPCKKEFAKDPAKFTAASLAKPTTKVNQ